MKSLGIVSNCWRVQLEYGVALEELIEEAVKKRYRAVELRQTCLGRFEKDNVPDADALAKLPKKFPSIRFNPALALPIWGAKVRPTDSLFAAGVDAAWSVAGAFFPHLRLVDPFTTQDRLPPDDTLIAEQIVGLAGSLIELGGILSIENARLPWNRLAQIIATAKKLLGLEESSLRLCYDPCNLFACGDGGQAAVITRSLAPDDVAMVHFKQSRDGEPLATVTDGDVDWQTQIAALGEIGYEGPALFEIAPHDDVWEHLSASRRYLGL